MIVDLNEQYAQENTIDSELHTKLNFKKLN